MHGDAAQHTISLLEAYELLAAQAEERIRRKLPPAVSCRPGCSACCRQLVVVSPLEAFAIARWIEERPDTVRMASEGERRFEAQLSPALRASLVDLHVHGGYPDPAAGGALEVGYFAAQVACPFLRDDRCAVYPARPFACREHFAVSLPELCAVDLDRVVSPPTRLEFKMVAAVAGQRVFGLEDRLIPLPLALDYVRDRPEEASRRAPAARFLAAAAIAERQVRGALARLARAGEGRPASE